MLPKVNYMALFLLVVPVCLAQNQDSDRLNPKGVFVNPPVLSSSHLISGDQNNKACALSVDSQALMELHNQQRREGIRCGEANKIPVPPLRYSCLLAQASLSHTRDMVKNQFLGHKGSDGSDIGVRANRAKYTWTRVGENVAQGFTSATAVNAVWLNSKGHCNNIMNADYNEMGAARVNNYWTVTFGRQ